MSYPVPVTGLVCLASWFHAVSLDGMLRGPNNRIYDGFEAETRESHASFQII